MKKIFIFFALIFSLYTAKAVKATYSDKDKITMTADSTADSAYCATLPAYARTFYAVIREATCNGIPMNIAFGLLHKESGYNGIDHYAYNFKLTSPHKAYGACQIKLGTAKLVDKKATKNKLINDVDYNISIAYRHLASLYDKYGDWKRALGAYNTGKPCVNKYAKTIYSYNEKTMYGATWNLNKG